ncbi:MAG TPA: D-alanyl-D-alanine carboxypeptidase [Thermoanaerobaculia bacterium]|jgi:D-alanyl-D-alanine carboxypeptidase/D-alanyl-D-alanine-endopeptidase (penicillin-binding protein 4)
MDVRLKVAPLLLLLLAACATAPPRRELATFVENTISTAPFDHALWGIHIEDDDGRVLYSLNGDKLMMPASNRKVFAAATIANCLGFEGQLTTEVWRDGDDLVLRGDGDPSLGSWRYERTDDFDRLADALRARGITRLRDVVADVSAFDRVTIPPAWKHGNLGSDYAAPVDALTWGENEIPTDRAVENPALYTATTLRDTLILRGVEVTGVARVNTERRAWSERLLALPSPFVGTLLRTVLKNSHNLYTEMLLKRSGDGTYATAFGKEALFAAKEAGVPADEFRFVDGSGLAPDNLVTPRAMIAMLRWMNEPTRRAMWWSLLATPDEEGTLRRRLTPLRERLRGKTGTIAGVNALSGVIAMPNGRYRYFTVVVNHHTGDDAISLIDAIVERAAM